MRIHVKIVGIVPIMINRFTDKAAQAATSGSRGSSASEERGTPLEQARDKLHLSQVTGLPVIPQPMILRCIVMGGKFHKIGKKQVTTQKESLLYAALDIEGVEFPIVHREPWRVDTRPVVNPATRGRILCHRPMFDDWAIAFEMVLDTTIMGPVLLRKIVDDAGRRCGLGDYRPGTCGPFGRFRVDEWREVEEMRELIQAAE